MAKNAGIVQSLNVLNSLAATMENADKSLDTTETGARALQKINRKIRRDSRRHRV